MKKIIMAITILLFFSLILAACGEEKEDSSEPNQTAPETNNEQDDNKPEEDSKTDEEDENDSQDSTGADFETGTDDQLDLGIGDTGTFVTLFGTYEVTLVSAKLEDEINGEKSDLDRFIILHFKIKNTRQEPQGFTNIIYSLEVTYDLESSFYSDAAEFFNGYEKMSGTLEPNEEVEGKFLVFVKDSVVYYFRTKPG